MRAFAVALVVILTAVTDASASPPGTFDRMFKHLPGLTSPTDQQLADLAQTMPDPNVAATEHPTAPAGVTFLGQFIDHDTTLDTSPSPIAPVNIRSLDNDRNGNLDLDSVYGDGPRGTPQLYEADRKHLRIGVSNGIPDVPREASGTAILGDGRNDENVIVAQLHAAFLRFHNRLVDQGRSFEDAQRLTRWHYQWVVLNEYLPEVAGASRVQAALSGDIAPYKPSNKHDPVLPVEFAVAAFRFGHSQVRRAYGLNDTSGGVVLFQPSGEDLRGGRSVPAGLGIQWSRFFQVPGAPAPSNLTRRIDTLIARPLFDLPIPGAASSGSNVLAFRNMVRGKFYGVPSGERVAQALGEPVTGVPAFADGTPLWFWILQEAQQLESGLRLGPVGARIVAEVFVTNLQRDPTSFFSARPAFTPSVPHEGAFDMGDFLRFAGVV